VTTRELADILVEYLNVYPEETQSLQLLQDQLTAGETLNSRKNFRGHITGAGIVLSPDKSKLLVVHHKFFDDWSQPGGHWEAGDPNPRTAAKREVIEETNADIAEQSPIAGNDLQIPLDIETYAYDARPEKNEPAHFHHDFRYVFLAKSENLKPQKSEVNSATWMPFDDPRLKNIQKSIAKLRQFKIIG
jgi:8-oxo-dGTP pyrophosphatase MutT (NUDIX family)